MQMDLSEVVDFLVVANSVDCYGYVFRVENCHIFRIAILFEVDSLRGIWRLRGF